MTEANGQQIIGTPRNRGFSDSTSSFRTPTLSRNAPGLAVANERPSSDIQQLMDVVSSIGQLAGAASGTARSIESSSDKEIRRSVKKYGPAAQLMGLNGEPNPGFKSDELAELYDIGQANRMLSSDLADFSHRASLPDTDPESLKIDPTVNALDQISSYMKGRIPDDMSPRAAAMYTDRFVDHALPIVANTIKRRQIAAIDDVVESMKVAVNGATSQESLDDIMADKGVAGIKQVKGWTDSDFNKAVAFDAAASTAAKGDPAKLEWFRKYIEPTNPSVWQNLTEHAGKEWSVKAMDRASSTINTAMAWDKPAFHVDADELRTTLHGTVPVIAERTKRSPEQVMETLLKNQLELAQAKGDVDRIDIIASAAGENPGAGVTDAITRSRIGALNMFRKNRLDQIVIDTKMGRVPLNDTMRTLESAGQVFAEDQNSKDGLSADQIDRAISEIGRHEQKTRKLDLDVQVVHDTYTQAFSGSSAPAPLTYDKSDAVINYWGRLGIADVRQGDNDSQTLVSIKNPEYAAALTNAGGFAPSGWLDQIKAGFYTSDDRQAQSARALLALKRTSPHIADKIVSELNGDAAARATAFLREAEAIVPAMARQAKPDENVTAANAVNPRGDVVNEQYLSTITQAWNAAKSLRAVPITNEQASKVVFSDVDATKDASDFLEKTFKDKAAPELNAAGYHLGTGFWFGSRTLTGYKDLDWATPSIEVTNYFKQRATESFKAQLANGVPDDVAAEHAKQLAANATFATYTPLVWNGTVYLDHDSFTYPGFEDHARARLTEFAKNHNLNTSVDAIMRDYRPRFDQQAKRWFFVNATNPQIQLPGIYLKAEDNQDKARAAWIEKMKQFGQSRKQQKTTDELMAEAENPLVGATTRMRGK